MHFVTHSPSQNHLLAALPVHDLQRLEAHLELTQLTVDQALYEPGGKLAHVYFPTSAVVSLLYVLRNGATAEIASVGNEGVLGISLFMGGNTTTSHAVVQSAGWSYRIGAHHLKTAFYQDGPLRPLLLRYIQALTVHVAQSVVCNRHHDIEQKLCRCLLLNFDRTRSNELAMTHEMIANMLGTRREGVTKAASHLQRAGCIRYSRGKITVLDRHGLCSRVCECYGVVKREAERLIFSIEPGDPRGVLGKPAAS